MVAKAWKAQPLHLAILDILERRGSITDAELLESLKNTSNYKDLSFNELNKALIKMEIAGIISVSSLTKGKRLVQLVKK